MTRSHTFSRALRRLHVFASSFDWFTGLSESFAIERIIKRFHSRDQRPYWFTKTKDDFRIKLKFNPRGMAWYTNMAAVSLFWNTNMVAIFVVLILRHYIENRSKN